MSASKDSAGTLQTVTKNAVVAMDYQLRLADDDVIDSSDNGDFCFLVGYENIVPGLEKALIGLKPGDERDVVVLPEDGYGVRDDGKVVMVPRSAFPDDFHIEIGVPLELEDEEGETSMAFITGVQDDEIVLDRNHPLASETLRFHVKIGEIRAATKEELRHGHVHGHGGHHH